MLDSVAEGVTVVENFTQSLFGKVFSHHIRFHLNRQLNDPTELRRIRIGRDIHGCLDRVKNFRVADESSLHNLGKTRENLSAGQGVKQVKIAEHGGRSVEHANEVLALGGVDSGLAPD